MDVSFFRSFAAGLKSGCVLALRLPAKEANSTSHKTIGVFGLALAAIVALGIAYNFRAGDRNDVLRVANQKGSTRALMVAAGVLKDAPYSVEWSEFPAAQQLLEAVGSGAADLGLAGDAPFIFAYESGSPIKAVGVLNTVGKPAGALAIIVPAGSSIRNVDDLVGKRIATTRGSIGHHLVLQALERAKIPAGKVTVTFLAPGDAKAAFDSRAVDAWAIWPPYVTVALKEGARTVVDAKDFSLPISFDVAHAPAIGPKRAMMRDFISREARALEWARTNPEAYAQALAKETGLPLDIARASFVRNNRTAARVDDSVIHHEAVVAKRFRAAGLLNANLRIEDAFDTTISPLKR